MSGVKGGRWIQHPFTGKLIPRDEYVRPSSNSAAVHTIKPFISPITKELITDRGQLRRHNEKHGVTNSADYSESYMKKRSDKRINEMTGNTHQAKVERIAMLNKELTKAGVR